MNQASHSETREIIVELKAIINEVLQILGEKEELVQNDVIKAREDKQSRA
jgi:hypothetical protein